MFSLAMSQNPYPQTEPLDTDTTTQPGLSKPRDSYVKLAMRNMVRKSGISLRHFALTSVGLLAALVGLAYLSR